MTTDAEREVVDLRKQVAALANLTQVYKTLLDKLIVAHRADNTVVEMALFQAYEVIQATLDGRDKRALLKAHEAETHDVISNEMRRRIVAALTEEKFPE